MGDATRPPCPLVAQRGGTAVPPLWKPLPRERGTKNEGKAPPLWKPLPELDGGAAAEREAEGVLFAPRCAPCPQMRRRTDLRFRYSAAGRWVLDFVGSAYRPLLRMGELAALPVNSSLTFFLFHRAPPTAKPCFLSRKPGLPFALLRRDQNNLLVKCQNSWYDNMKNLKGCLR